MNAKKILVALLAVFLIIGCTVGATLAWLKDSTETITNTFTTSDVDIDLAETTTVFKMVPGSDIAKDPKVTVKAGSEDCWLFVVIEEVNDFATYMSYGVADGWTPLTDADNNGVADDGVYYREAKAGDEFAVLADNKVHVLDSVTKAMMNSFDEDKNGELSEAEMEKLPKLTFTAYAVQKVNVDAVADAWNIAQGLNPDGTTPNP